MSQDYRATKSFVDPQDASENQPTNRSGNRPFEDVLGAALSRRGMLLGSLATAASTGFLAPAAIAQPRDPSARRPGGLLGFRSLTIEEATQDPKVPSISDDYTFQPLIPWGTPIEPGATRPYNGEPDRRPTPEEAELQVGIGHDGIWFFPEIRNAFADTYAETALQFGSSRKGMLCVNHEFGRTPHVIGKEVPENLEDVRVMQAVHGVSVVAIEERSREWEVVASPNARRITVNTPVAFSGPAADSPLLQNPAGNVPLGTVNNCGSGATPWGTYLTCEENFNGYFGGADFQGDDRQARYGFSQEGFSYDWYKFDKRFDLTEPAYENEQNRFGWVVEIDPYDGTQTPVKRTAMGRLKHEAVAIAVSGNGRVAAYMGDDQRFDYCYKYVSDRPWREAVEAGDSPLDEGTLYVARFDEDGTGEWLPLTIDNPELAAEFTDQGELLIFARVAADIVGATPMDRPEWTTVGQNGSVFWTLTNNTARTEPNAANPLAPNPDGHIIKTVDSNDYLGTSFTWEIFILAADTAETEGAFASPDAAYADPYGRLFIGTDGSQPQGLQDQVVVFDTTEDNPQPKRLLTGVASDEITGWAVTPDFRTAFTNIQHPGNGDPSATNFPAPTDGTTIPRDCTLVITQKRGNGVVGS